MTSADFSLLVVTAKSSMRPHGISSESFPRYPPDPRLKVTIAFWDFDALCLLIRLKRLCIRFLCVGPRFRYCFLSPTSHDVKLTSRYRIRRQLRSLGLSPKIRVMPVGHKKTPRLRNRGVFRHSILIRSPRRKPTVADSTQNVPRPTTLCEVKPDRRRAQISYPLARPQRECGRIKLFNSDSAFESWRRRRDASSFCPLRLRREESP